MEATILAMLYEKEQLLLDKQKELIEFRQLVAQTIASQKRIGKLVH